MKLSFIEKKVLHFVDTEIVQDSNLTITKQTSLINGGLVDSYALVNMSLFLEKTFEIVVSEEELTINNFDTVENIVKLVISKL